MKTQLRSKRNSNTSSRALIRSHLEKGGYNPPPTKVNSLAETLTFATGHIYVKHTARKNTRKVLEKSISQLEIAASSPKDKWASTNKLQGKTTKVKLSGKKGKGRGQSETGDSTAFSFAPGAEDGFISHQHRLMDDAISQATSNQQDNHSTRTSKGQGGWHRNTAPASVPARPTSARSTGNSRSMIQRAFRNSQSRAVAVTLPGSRPKSTSASVSSRADKSFGLSHAERLDNHAVERWGTWAQRVQDMSLIDLQRERVKVLRLGFKEKVQWIDYLLELERGAIQLDKKGNLVTELKSRLALLQKGYRIRLHVLQKQLRKEKQMFEDTIQAEFEKIERRHAQEYETLVLRAVSKASASCSCEKPYLCQHNFSFPLKDWRPSPAVLQLRRNATRLAREGFIEDAAFENQAADQIERAERRKYIESLKGKVAGSKEGNHPVPTPQLDRLVARHAKEMHHWEVEVETKTKRLANEHAKKKEKLHFLFKKESDSIMKESRKGAVDIGLDVHMIRDVMETSAPEDPSRVKEMIIKSRSAMISSLQPSNLDALSKTVLESSKKLHRSKSPRERHIKRVFTSPAGLNLNTFSSDVHLFSQTAPPTARPQTFSSHQMNRPASARSARSMHRPASVSSSGHASPFCSPMRPQVPPRITSSPRRERAATSQQHHGVTAWGSSTPEPHSHTGTDTPTPREDSESYLAENRSNSLSSSITELEIYPPTARPQQPAPNSTLEETGELAFGIPSRGELARYQCQMHAHFLCLLWAIRAKDSFQKLLESPVFEKRFEVFCGQQQARGILQFYMDSASLEQNNGVNQMMDQNQQAIKIAEKYWGSTDQGAPLVDFLVKKRQEAFKHLYCSVFPAFLSSPETLQYIENILEEKNNQELLSTTWLQAFQNVGSEIPWGAAIGDAATPEYRILYCNKALENQMGFAEDDILGTPISSLFEIMSTKDPEREKTLARKVPSVLRNHQTLYLRQKMGGEGPQAEGLVLLAPVWSSMNMPTYYVFMQVPFSSFENEMELLSLCEILNFLPLKVGSQTKLKQQKHFSRFKQALKNGYALH